MKTIKLSEYCRREGISYRTGWKRFKNGEFGDSGTVNSKGSMFVKVEESSMNGEIDKLKGLIARLELILNSLKLNDGK